MNINWRDNSLERLGLKSQDRSLITISCKLDDKVTQTIKIRVNIPNSMEEELVKCLKDNVGLFNVSTKEMSNINPIVPYQ